MAAILFWGHMVVVFCMEHNGMSEPLVVIVEVSFEQENNVEFFYIEIAQLFLQ